MIIKKFVTGLLENNMYLIADGKDAVLIDAPYDSSELRDYIKENGLNIKYILLTHGHFDHIAGLTSLKQNYGAKAFLHKDDLIISDNINEFTRMLNLPEINPPEYDFFVKDNDTITLGNLNIKVIHTPGHTQGGVCYLIEDNLFSGDTLFKQSVGRTDLFGGDFKKLSNSIKNIIFKLDDNTKVYPGHGDMTTIRYEKKYNEIL